MYLKKNHTHTYNQTNTHEHEHEHIYANKETKMRPNFISDAFVTESMV